MRNGSYLLFIAVLLGIVSSTVWPQAFFELCFCSLLIVILISCSSLFVSKIKRKNIFYVAFIFLSFLLGMFRMHVIESQPSQHSLDQFVDKKVTLKGLINAEPDVRDSDILITVKVGSTNVLLLASPGPPYEYGDIITAEGKIVRPKNFQTDSGTVFDYVHYLAKDGIFYEMKMSNIKIVDRGKGNIVLEKLFAVKKAFTNNADKVIPYPESALLGGILFGNKRSLGTTLLSAFQTSGVIHMVVISGYNISIVANAVGATLSIFPRAIGLAGGAVSIILFVAMTGFSGASVRAAIMGLIAIAGLSLRRNYNSLHALFISGTLMILWNPLTLLYDPSFQLSFIATLGIILLPPILERFLGWLPEILGSREIIASTLSAEIILLPLLLYMNGSFSLFALPANLLVLFPVPLTMLLGFFTGLFGFAGIYPSIPLAFVSFLLLSYELDMVVWFSKLPFALIQLTFPFWAMIFVYAIYAVIIFLIKKKTPAKVL